MKTLLALVALLLAAPIHGQTFRLEGESRDATSSGQTGDDALVTPRNGEWIAFDNVNFTGASTVTVTAARGDGSAQMTVRIGSPTGQSLGTKTVSTGGWRTFQDFTYPTTGITGSQKLYVLSGNPEKPVIQRVKVNGTAGFNKVATDFDDLAQSLKDRDFYFVSLQSSWARYDNVNLTGIASLTASVANGVTGKIEFRIGSPTGTKIAEISTSGTSSEWRVFKNYDSAITGSHGIVTLYLVGTGGHGGVIDYIDFQGTSNPAEIVRTSGNRDVAGQRHDGGLRPVVGVHEYALFRPTKSTVSNAGPLDGHAVYNTTFNHHPFLTYWNNRFWATFIAYDGKSSNSATEATKRLRLQWSDDGRTWNHADAADIFPTPRATHQRCAFYIASNGKLLVTTWYSQNGEAGRGGVGSRLVREILGANSFGTIYTLKQNVNGASNAGYPMFTTSADTAFKAAAQELLDDPLQQQSRWEEDRDTSHAQIYDEAIDTQYDHEAKAFQWYRLADQRIVGHWKGDWFGVTSGTEWDRADITMDKLVSRFGNHTQAKAWGEPLTTGRYAMMFCRPTQLPSPFFGATMPWYGWDCRTPLAVTTSADGFHYDSDYLAISGDSGPQIYRNAAPTDNKAVGPSYMRGLTFVANRETAKTRPNDNMWVTYSTNKEYIWVTEIPKEMSATVADHVDDDLTAMTPGGRVGMWNIRDSAWGSARLVSDAGGSVLQLADKDRYDYAKAVRVFPESTTATINTRVRPGQSNTGELHLELMSHDGKRPVRLRFDSAGNLQRYGTSSWSTLSSYTTGTWHDLVIACDTAAKTWTLSVNGSPLGGTLPFSEDVASVERVEYRTGAWRMDDFSTNMFGGGTPGDRTTALPNADDPVALATFDIASLQTSGSFDPSSPENLIASIGSVSTGKAYVTGTVAAGALPYIDRSYSMTAVPAALDGAEMIRTANDDEFVSTANHLSFTLSSDAEVHVMWSWSPNDGSLALPPWMNGFTENPSLQITTTDNGRVYRSFSKGFSAGQHVLGGNDRSNTKAQANYFVAVKVAAPPLVATTRLPDGSIQFGDDATAYGSVQDGQNGTATSLSLSADRRSATLGGNGWKRFPLSYTVTASTVLEVTVEGSDAGEIIGIALDDDTDPTSGRRAFLLGGSDVNGSSHSSWSWTLSPRYSAGGEAMAFTIPVGTYFTGTITGIGLIGDDDGNASAAITFSAVRLHEGVPTTYGGWSASIEWGSTPTDRRDPDDDPDGDGRNNRTERALGTDPTIADQPTDFEIRVVPQTGGATFTMYYVKHAPDETYRLVHSTALAAWSDSSVSAEQWDAASSRHYRTCTVTGPVGFATLRLEP